MINRKLFNRAMKSNGSSVCDLAYRLKIHPQTLYQKLRGAKGFTLREALAIKQALSITQEDFFTIFDDKEADHE